MLKILLIIFVHVGVLHRFAEGSNKYFCGCMFATGCYVDRASCCPGLSCQSIDKQGSTQCLESNSYLIAKGCTQTNQNGCIKNSDCCNPSAVCSIYNNCILNFTCTYHYQSPDPSSRPSTFPSSQPIKHPIAYPTSQPKLDPTSQPKVKPSKQPSRQPANDPTTQPTKQPFRRPVSRPSSQPSRSPILKPSKQPIRHPSRQPSQQPKRHPSKQPTSQPFHHPSKQPSQQPSSSPSLQPKLKPLSRPSVQPTSKPSIQPSHRPSAIPLTSPSQQPSKKPTLQPRCSPSRIPSCQPSQQPREKPTSKPSLQPQQSPTAMPSTNPTLKPFTKPSRQPYMHPSALPTKQPVRRPSAQPWKRPSVQPISCPTIRPTLQRIELPSQQPLLKPSQQPNVQPTKQPLRSPTTYPSRQPSRTPTCAPSKNPYNRPSSIPLSLPSSQPIGHPSQHPSHQPNSKPTNQPFDHPSTMPSQLPSEQPKLWPSSQPTISPVITPSVDPSRQPTEQPQLVPKASPTKQPVYVPTMQPNGHPSSSPTLNPVSAPTFKPFSPPSLQPITEPSMQPTQTPQEQPSSQPNCKPTFQPSGKPTLQKVVSPTGQPIIEPTGSPSEYPSLTPTIQPTANPTTIPSQQPYISPSSHPTELPTVQISSAPTYQPLGLPTHQPFALPTIQPFEIPSRKPSEQPSQQPNRHPTLQPYSSPSAKPTGQSIMSPSKQPLTYPSAHPSRQPFVRPSDSPSKQPESIPSKQPNVVPTASPSTFPSYQPSSIPTLKPSIHPVQFEASLMLVNMTVAVLDPIYTFALLYTISNAMDIATTDIVLLNSIHSRKLLATSFVDVCRTKITVSSAEFPQFKNNGSALFNDLKNSLHAAVYNGEATSTFRKKLSQLGTENVGHPAIVAVAFNEELVIPTVAPTKGPDNIANTGSPSSVNKVLLLGLVGGVFAFMCVLMPVLFLVRNAVNKKFKAVATDIPTKLVSSNAEEKNIDEQKNGPPESVTRRIKKSMEQGAFILSKPFNRVAPSFLALRDRARGVESRSPAVKALDFSDYLSLYNSDFGGAFEENHPNLNQHETFNDDDIAFSNKTPSPIINEQRSTVADSEITMLNSVKLDARTAIYRDARRLEKQKKYSFFASVNSSNTPEEKELFDLSDFYPEPERFRTEVAASLSSMSTSFPEKSISMKRFDNLKGFSDDSSCDGFVNRNVNYDNARFKSSILEGIGIATPPIPGEPPFLNERVDPNSENRVVESRIKLLQRNFKNDTPCSPLPPKHTPAPGGSANTVRLAEIYPNNEEVFQSSKLARESVMNMSDVYPEEVGIRSVATLEIIRLEFPEVELMQMPTLGGGLGSNNSSRPPSPMHRNTRARSDSQSSLNLQDCAASSMNYGSPSPLPQLRSMKSRKPNGLIYGHSSPPNSRGQSPQRQRQPQQQQSPVTLVSRNSREDLIECSDGNYNSPQNLKLHQPRWSGKADPIEVADDYFTPPSSFRTKASRTSRADTQESFPTDDFNSPQSVKFRAIKTKFETMIQKNTNSNRIPKLSRLNNTPT